MDPNEISRLISEDVRVNNGLVCEASSATNLPYLARELEEGIKTIEHYINQYMEPGQTWTGGRFNAFSQHVNRQVHKGILPLVDDIENIFKHHESSTGVGARNIMSNCELSALRDVSQGIDKIRDPNELAEAMKLVLDTAKRASRQLSEFVTHYDSMVRKAMDENKNKPGYDEYGTRRPRRADQASPRAAVRPTRH